MSEEQKKTELEEYNERHPVRRDPDTGVVTDHRTGEQKGPGLFGRIKQKVSAFDEAQHQKNEQRRLLNAKAKGAEQAAYEQGLIKGRTKRGFQRGMQAGMGGGGRLGQAGHVLSVIGQHLPDPAETERALGFGASTSDIEGSLYGSRGHSGGGMGPNIAAINESLGLGMGRRAPARHHKGKKRVHRRRAPTSDPYADFGF
jgi:hypothetical protein